MEREIQYKAYLTTAYYKHTASEEHLNMKQHETQFSNIHVKMIKFMNRFKFIQTVFFSNGISILFSNFILICVSIKFS